MRVSVTPYFATTLLNKFKTLSLALLAVFLLFACKKDPVVEQLAQEDVPGLTEQQVQRPRTLDIEAAKELYRMQNARVTGRSEGDENEESPHALPMWELALQMDFEDGQSKDIIMVPVQLLGEALEIASYRSSVKLAFYLGDDGLLHYRTVLTIPEADENCSFRDEFHNFTGFRAEMTDEGEIGNFFRYEDGVPVAVIPLSDKTVEGRNPLRAILTFLSKVALIGRFGSPALQS